MATSNLCEILGLQAYMHYLYVVVHECVTRTPKAQCVIHVHAYHTTNILHCTKYITYLPVDLYTALLNVLIDEILGIIINKRRLQRRRATIFLEYTCYTMSYKDIIHTYYILIVMLKLIKKVFFIRIASPRAFFAKFIVAYCIGKRQKSNPSHKQLDISPVDQNIANTNRRNDTGNIAPNFNILVPY